MNTSLPGFRPETHFAGIRRRDSFSAITPNIAVESSRFRFPLEGESSLDYTAEGDQFVSLKTIKQDFHKATHDFHIGEAGETWFPKPETEQINAKKRLQEKLANLAALEPNNQFDHEVKRGEHANIDKILTLLQNPEVKISYADDHTINLADRLLGIPENFEQLSHLHGGTDKAEKLIAKLLLPGILQDLEEANVGGQWKKEELSSKMRIKAGQMARETVKNHSRSL